jgi:putative methanogenesis marker protein 5
MVYPPTSIVIADLIKRIGHEPLVTGKILRDKVGVDLDSPPYEITLSDLKRSLKYLSVETPAGMRGRIALMMPLIEKAEAAIIVMNPDFSFGCGGCDRASKFLIYQIKSKGIPILEVQYPNNKEEAVIFVKKIMDFLRELGG